MEYSGGDMGSANNRKNGRGLDYGTEAQSRTPDVTGTPTWFSSLSRKPDNLPEKPVKPTFLVGKRRPDGSVDPKTGLSWTPDK